MTISTFEQLTVDVPAVAYSKGGLRLRGSPVTVSLPAQPRSYLYSGWQSWSLTAWVKNDRPVRRMRPSRLHPMQTDPVYVNDPRPNGSWYGAVELPDDRIVLLGAVGLEAHVALEGNSLKGWSETGSGEWFLGVGTESELLERYSELLGEHLGGGRAKTSPRVWCSWYSLYTEIDEPQLLKILDDLGLFGSPQSLPFEVFQVDDGWQRAIGDWEANGKFPSGMDSLAARIRASGRTAGLWLAPLLVVPSSSLYREHPEWLLHDESGGLVPAGFNWGEPLFALDTTHPGALDWLSALMKKVRAWGYDYAKLDFLYAGALPGKRHNDMPRETAYRNGLGVLREALGEAFLLTCGAPILPSLGLCDGLRVGPDVAGQWASNRDDSLLMNFATPGGRNALRTTLHRLWLRPLVQTDPDVVYFRRQENSLSSEQIDMLKDLSLVAGFKATSDVPAWLSEAERRALRTYLEDTPAVSRSGRYSYQVGDRSVDFGSALDLPPLPGALTNLLGALVGGLADMPFLLGLLDRLGRRVLRRTLAKNPV